MSRTAALAFLLTTMAGAAAGQIPDARRFVGTWRLARVELDDKPYAPFGPRPSGQLNYDAGGRMAAQIAPDRDRPSWPSGTRPTPEQALAAISGYVAYFGTYSVDSASGTVSHHREGALNLNSPDFVRRYEFSADGRELSLLPVDNPRMRLVWERLP